MCLPTLLPLQTPSSKAECSSTPLQEFMTQGSLKLKILEQMISPDEVREPRCGN